MKYHFIGVCGISMSGLAEILLRAGHNVTGSDMAESATADHLRRLGISVAVPNRAENIPDDTDTVVFTAAIRADNPEYIEAKRRGIKMLERAEMLGLLLENYENSVCVAGSHGKTSTSALLAEIMLAADLDPTINVGGRLPVLDNANYRAGSSSYFLLESCEYSGSFHHFFPKVAIILNIDADHLDHYGTFENVVASFRKFAGNVKSGGTLVVAHDIISVGSILLPTEIEKPTGKSLLPVEIVTFGLSEGDYTASNIEYNAHGQPSFDILHQGVFLAHVNLPLPGEYSMLNALAVFAAACALGISAETTANALSNVQGVKRRFEYKGEYNGATIIDDYAHHPTEIVKCLAAARQRTCIGKLYCIFQPHTYTRTRNHLADFCTAFGQADEVFLLPIYAAREPFDPSISSLHLQEGIGGSGGNVTHFDTHAMAVNHLKTLLQPGDMLITMGAGDVYLVGESLLST